MRKKRKSCKGKNCGKCTTCIKRRWRKLNPILYAFEVLKHNAKRRRVKFELTVKEFTKFCVATRYIELKGQRAEDLTIDRKVNVEGYTYDNIRAIPNSENAAKGVRPPNEEEQKVLESHKPYVKSNIPF